ncbi:MAG: CDP-diacylglycerol--serine O-phosphatidyltransferase [Pseudomonadales bacterium]
MNDESSNEQQSGKTTPLENLLPIDEHVEEVSEGGRKVKRRGVFLLPNLFTTAALFAGFYAIVAAINGNFEAAGLAIFFGQLLDGMDGRIARLTNSQSKFGEEYDSLSDMVTFGVAPALVMFMWCLSGLGKLGWSVAFIYVACTALRLARFNAQADTADKRFFTGLASPPAATLIAATVWTGHDMGYVGLELSSWIQGLLAFETALVGLMMMLNVPYHSFKGVDFKGRVPFAAVFAVMLVFVVITIDPPRVLFALALTYALSGPVIYVWKKMRGGRKPESDTNP